MKKEIVVMFLLIVLQSTNRLHAQYQRTIQTDRPGQAIGPLTVGKNVFQTQTGIDFGGFNDKTSSLSSTNLIPNTVLRYGLTNYFEINTSWAYRADRYNLSDSVYSTTGLNLGSIGARFNITEGRGAMPVIGLQVGFMLPVNSKPYHQKFIAPSVMLITSKQLSDKFSFVCNLGISYDGNSPEPTGLYVANLGYSISDKFSTYVEGYGSFSAGSFEAKWDTGLGYLVNNNFQLDIYGGISNNSGVTDYFASLVYLTGSSHSETFQITYHNEGYIQNILYRDSQPAIQCRGFCAGRRAGYNTGGECGFSEQSCIGRI